MDLAVALATFALIIPVELPDKTFVATLVLATRYRPLQAWIGVTLAFAVQSLVAVAFGDLISALPDEPVTLAAAALFAAGGVILLRGASLVDADEAEEEFAGRVTAAKSGLRAVLSSFLVLFLAEWGDLSQLLTVGLAARYHDPVAVFLGSWTALALVAGAAALLGRALLRRMRLSTIRRIGGWVCLVLATLTALAAAGVDLPI